MNLMIEKVEQALDALMKNGKPFAIWGGGREGYNGKDYIEKYTKGNIKETCVVDNNPTLWGRDNIISPKEFFDRKDEFATVFICVYVADEVEKQLRDGGYKGETIVFLTSSFAGNSTVELYDNHKEEIRELKEILADDLSVKTLDAFYEFAKTGDISVWDGVNGKSLDKVIEPDVTHPQEGDYFVDIGAFTGDTIKSFLGFCGGKYKKIVGIEPEIENYKALEKYLKEMPNTLALQVAVSDNSGKMKMTSGLSEGSHISQEGDAWVDVVRVDDLEELSDTTFLKISTMGYELAVLKGARNLLKNNKPKLAYYCGGTQCWEIPFFLKSLDLGYKIYIRHYGLGLQALAGFAI